MSGGVGRALSALWPWLSSICLVDCVFLVFGSVVLAGWLDVNAPQFFVYSLFVAVAGLPLAILAGIARDLRRAGRDAHPATSY